MISKTEALSKFLGCLVEEPYEGQFEASDGGEYRVLTDSEADVAVRAHILDSVWAFRADFLEAHMDLDADTIKIIQEAKYEDANGPLLKLINDPDHFVEDAVMSDGRGHFLASYDSEENEASGYFIYRVN
jgi:hypothetical protein